jgi:anthranilate synthase component 1
MPIPCTSGSCVVHTLDGFPDLAGLHQANPRRYPHLLESVAHGTPQARYDILFAFPGNTLSLDSSGRLHWPDGALTGDFLTALDQVWRAASNAGTAQVDCAVPFTGGWLLYLGYELAHTIEPASALAPPASDLPVAFATRFPAAIIRDHSHRRTHLVCESGADHLLATLRADALAAEDGVDTGSAGLRMTLNEEPPERYLQGIQRILDYIRAGDVFQVNLSRQWQGEMHGDFSPVDIYRRLRRTNPAPFAGLLTLGAQQAVISSSPERLAEVRGGMLRTRPIAGTSPRSPDRQQDRAWSDALLRHPKERAEHIMLLDLERNDVGRVCIPGTVRVSEFMRLESYAHVHHIVSAVEGRLRPEVTPGQVMRAVFPGGTITGCPKVRTMQIIAELEQTGRGAYTGSMGYLNHDGSMDLNILIRTLVQNGRHIRLRAGGGIVADSDPQRELRETQAKAQGLLAALTGSAP